MKQKLEHQVELALKSLDNLEKVSPRDDLFNSIEQAIASDSSNLVKNSWRKIASIAAIFIFLVNVYVVINSLENSSEASENYSPIHLEYSLYE